MFNDLVHDEQRKFYRTCAMWVSQCLNSEHDLFRSTHLNKKERKHYVLPLVESLVSLPLSFSTKKNPPLSFNVRDDAFLSIV